MISYVSCLIKLLQIFTDVSDVTDASIVLTNKAANTSETSVNIYQSTWRNIPEDSHLHIRRFDNLKY
jgi:hypothetical protein